MIYDLKTSETSYYMYLSVKSIYNCTSSKHVLYGSIHVYNNI